GGDQFFGQSFQCAVHLYNGIMYFCIQSFFLGPMGALKLSSLDTQLTECRNPDFPDDRRAYDKRPDPDGQLTELDGSMAGRKGIISRSRNAHAATDGLALHPDQYKFGGSADGIDYGRKTGEK